MLYKLKIFNIFLFFHFQTNVGPIVLSVNPYRDVGNPLTLTSTRHAAHGDNCAALGKHVTILKHFTKLRLQRVFNGLIVWALLFALIYLDR